jgi:hypothetical protein
MKTYTVVGLVGIDDERYGTSVEAVDAREAEDKACAECLEANGDNLQVAAVIEGKVKIVG